MTNRPYTDDDLRATAAEFIATAIREITPSEIADRMDRNYVQSTNTGDESRRTWEELLNGDGLDTTEFLAARQQIDDLIRDAADVSEWAIQLGADGLEPDGHTIQLGVDPGDGDRPQVRLHFAFHPDMAAADRDRFAMELSKAVLRNL